MLHLTDFVEDLIALHGGLIHTMLWVAHECCSAPWPFVCRPVGRRWTSGCRAPLRLPTIDSVCDGRDRLLVSFTGTRAIGPRCVVLQCIILRRAARLGPGFAALSLHTYRAKTQTNHLGKRGV